MSEKTKRLKYYKFIFKDDGYPLGIEHYEDGEKVSVHWFTQREARALRDWLNQQELGGEKKYCYIACSHEQPTICDGPCKESDGTRLVYEKCKYGKLHGRSKAK